MEQNNLTTSTLPPKYTQTPEPSFESMVKNRLPMNSNSKNKLIFSFIAIILLISILTASYFLSSRNQDIRSRASLSGASLSTVPATKVVQAGNEFPISVLLNTSIESVSGVEIELSYDPTSVQVVSFTPSSYLPVILRPVVHAYGISSVALGVNPTSPFRGSAVIGTFNVKILKTVNSSIVFTPSTTVAVLGKNINGLTLANGTNFSANQSAVSAPQAPVTSPSVLLKSNPATTLPTTTITLPVRPRAPFGSDPRLSTTPAITQTATSTVQPTNSIISVSPTTLPEGKKNQLYSATINISKVARSANPRVEISGLPFGVHQGSCVENSAESLVTCTISGTPPISGAYSVRLSVVDGNGFQTNRAIPLMIR